MRQIQLEQIVSLYFSYFVKNRALTLHVKCLVICNLYFSERRLHEDFDEETEIQVTSENEIEDSLCIQVLRFQ